MSDLTREEKIESITNWCGNHDCVPKHCRIYDLCHQYPGDWRWHPDEVIDKVYETLWEGNVDIHNLSKEHIVNPQCKVNMFDGDNADACWHEFSKLNGIKSHEAGNQTAKADYGKEELTLVPRRIIHDICAIRMYGNRKYPDGGPDNWKQVEIERYRNAAYRHFLAYIDDPQGKDEESGFPHLWHLACNIAFLCEMEEKHE